MQEDLSLPVQPAVARSEALMHKGAGQPDESMDIYQANSTFFTSVNWQVQSSTSQVAKRKTRPTTDEFWAQNFLDAMSSSSPWLSCKPLKEPSAH